MKKKKNILIVCTDPITFKYILVGQPRILNRDFKISVASNNLEEIKKIGLFEGVSFYCIPMYRKINPLFDLFSIYSLCKLLKSINPDIVHSYTPKAGLISSISGFLIGVPVRLHTFTGLIFPYKGKFLKKVLSKVDSLICYLNTHIVAEGKGVKEQLKRYKITPKNINIIGNGNIAGIDLGFFKISSEILKKSKMIKKENNIEKGSFNFIFIGRLNRDKGIKELFTAFNSINKKNINLLIVGEYEDEKFKQEVQNNYSLNLIFFGWQNDIRPYLAASQCLLLPSYREGFPNVLLQAGAMKIPCLVTDVPGSNEIIIENLNGWIIPSKNILELKSKIIEISGLSKDKLKTFGENAYKNVALKYERNNFHKKLISFYESL